MRVILVIAVKKVHRFNGKFSAEPRSKRREKLRSVVLHSKRLLAVGKKLSEILFSAWHEKRTLTGPEFNSFLRHFENYRGLAETFYKREQAVFSADFISAMSRGTENSPFFHRLHDILGNSRRIGQLQKYYWGKS